MSKEDAKKDDNPNPKGGADVRDVGKSTRFGAKNGNVPRPDTSWSVRQMLRYLAASDVDIMDIAAVEYRLGKKLSNGQLIALRQIQRATKEEANQRSAEFVTDNIEGKLAQTTINADWESIKKMTDDELRADIASQLTGMYAPESEVSGVEETGADAGSDTESPEA